MSYVQECPGCKARLRIAEGIDTPTVTCPRCLAEAPNLRTQAAPAQAEPVPQGHISCPRCGKAVLPHYYFCPHCNAAIYGREAHADKDDAEREVQGDTKRTGCLLIVLAVLGVIGTVSYGLPLMGAALADRDRTAAQVLTISVAVLIVIAGVVLAFGWGRWTIGESILRVFAAIGAVMVAGVVLIAALVIFLFIVCLAGGPMRFH
jgi:hypothetical protein